MSKYRLLREAVEKLSASLTFDLQIPEPASDQQLCLVHEPSWVRRVAAGQLTQEEIRRIGFPWSTDLVERSRRSVGATICAGRASLEDAVAVNLAGGTHHAFPGYGRGYCVFNDVAVAARVLQQESRVQRVLVIDCDVHQGDGTAAIFQDDESVYTFSIHALKAYPARKQISDLDIALPPDTGDQHYLTELQQGLSQAISEFQADTVFYLAGADPFLGDTLGGLRLTTAGLAMRDQMVFAACRDAGLPVAVSMAGGYARDVRQIVEIHLNTIRTAGLYARKA